MQRRTFRSLGMALVGVLALGAAACDGDTIIPGVQTLTVTPQSITLQVGATAQVVPQTTGITAPQFTFSTSNASVAGVDGNGTVTAVSAGSATITVRETTTNLAAAVQVTVTAPPVGPAPTLSISPASATIAAGSNVTLVAVRGNTTRGVDWSVPDTTAVRIVSQDSLQITLQGKPAGGSASVLATLRGSPTVQAAATVTVTAVAPAAVTVGAITVAATNVPVNPAAIAGQIDVTLNVTPGTADALRVFLVPTEAGVPEIEVVECRRSVAGAPQVIVCPIPTAQFSVDAEGNVTVRFRNRDYRIVPRLLRGDEVVAQATSEVLTFRNVDTILGSVRAPTQGNDALGFLWLNGDLTVQAHPVIYSMDTGELATVSVTIGDNPALAADTGQIWRFGATTQSTQTRTAAQGFSFTFTTAATPAAGGLNQVNSGQSGAIITMNSVTVGGQQGPSGNRFVIGTLQSGTSQFNAVVRYDNESPNPGLLGIFRHPVWATAGAAMDVRRNGWVNGEYLFMQGKFNQNDVPFTPAGIGLRVDNPVRIFAARGADLPAPPAGSTAAQIIAFHNNWVVTNGSEVTRGDQLAASATNEEYIVVARVWDRLENNADIRLRRDVSRGGTLAQGAFPDDWNVAGATGIVDRVGTDFVRPIQMVVDSLNRHRPFNVANPWRVSAIDTAAAPVADVSGIAAVRFTTDRFTCTLTQARCEPAAATTHGTSTIAVPIGAAAANVEHQTDTLSIQAYYRARATSWDRAGNSALELTSNNIIFDAVAVSLSTVTIPSVVSFVGGQPYRFTATSEDNVDVKHVHMGYRFPTVDLPLHEFHRPDGEFLSPFGPSLVYRRFVGDHDQPHVRTLQAASGVDGAPNYATVMTPQAVFYRAWDHQSPYGSIAEQATPFGVGTIAPPPATNPLTADPARAINATEFTASPLRWRVRGPTGTFTNPFVRVVFLFRDEMGVIRILRGTVVTQVDETAPAGATGRRWTYTFSGAVPTSSTVWALGITSNGDALLSAEAITDPPEP